MTRIVTFGEVMGRLCPSGFQRFRQALPGSLDFTFGGAEANVAASLTLMGIDTALVTVLPKHAIADACVGVLRNVGVRTEHIVRSDEGRLGLVFLETGANQRPSQVIYDRTESSIGQADPAIYDWATIFSDATWFHVTGITPAISKSAAHATIDAVTQAKAAGITVSTDLNFRGKLWRWDPASEPKALAQQTLRKILPHVDLVMANEEDCCNVLGIRAGRSDVDSGRLEIDRYPEVAQEVVRQFPNVRKVAISLRESLSASHNRWGAMLWDAECQQAHFAPIVNGSYEPYVIRNIVDRVGAGDALAAGLIFAFNTPELAHPSTALPFAVAASCLAHSTVGDWNYATRSEIEKLMHGSKSGRVER